MPAAVADDGELRSEQHELTRLLLADLHRELDGRGGDAWARAWELAGTVDRHPGTLDGVLTHPYTRGWLLGSLDALREGGAGAAPLPAARLASTVAAAAVRGGLDLAVPVPYEGGTLLLPTLGELRFSGVEPSGTAEVRPVEKGLLVRAGGSETRIPRPDEPGACWRPVRRLGRDGAPDLAIDDLDPYRDCFGVPVPPRLGHDEAAAWTDRLACAWGLLRARAPEQAAAAAASLTTLTPSTARGPRSGGTESALWASLCGPVPRSWRRCCCAAGAGRACGPCWRSPTCTRTTAGGRIRRRGRSRRSRCPSCWRGRTNAPGCAPSTRTGRRPP
ncbi:radical SAM/SPASM protein FxsBH, inactivated beta-hydroxylase extension form [Streptomyces sp. I6]|uniref:radical SAM/SPASM protein FxsBH, inactivated beta-hydroxylase extension form n=1 Tax=Streptomyces sp. I6 TaxID=2483113 RepID=UPI002880184B|nr:radical SAM/SPASM protein FxsB, inactivated metallohydrolase extension form [Streptomyces sp. I6]